MLGGGTRREPRFKALRMHNKKLLPHYKVIQGRLHTTYKYHGQTTRIPHPLTSLTPFFCSKTHSKGTYHCDRICTGCK